MFAEGQTPLSGMCLMPAQVQARPSGPPHSSWKTSANYETDGDMMISDDGGDGGEGGESWG